jgi:hypothetical protein
MGECCGLPYFFLSCLAFSHLFYCSFLTTSYFAFSLILSYPLLSLVACSALLFSSLIQYVHGMCVVLTAVYSLFSFFSEIHSISCVRWNYETSFRGKKKRDYGKRKLNLSLLNYLDLKNLLLFSPRLLNAPFLLLFSIFNFYVIIIFAYLAHSHRAISPYIFLLKNFV